MEAVFVKPAEGGRVRMPDRGSSVMPADGMAVARTMYYERLIATGDLVVDQARTDEFNAGHKEAMEKQAAAVTAVAERKAAEQEALAQRQPTVLPAEKSQPLGNRHPSPPPAQRK